MTVQVVILAAGLGTRLARPHPKPLTTLVDGRTILQQQVHNLQAAFGEEFHLTIVVGFKLRQIIEHVPDASFVYNENYGETNTSKSLLKALKNTLMGGVLWLNGDVVFDPKLLELMKPFISEDKSVIAVNTAKVSDEEVKYTVDGFGHINQLSKTVPVTEALGEAIGINYIAKRDKPKMIHRLDLVDDHDYYEQAIEDTILGDNIDYSAVDTSGYIAIEIDSQEDLNRANEALSVLSLTSP